jgi:site-specific DNA-methyltransferase (adenine-specific)
VDRNRLEKAEWSDWGSRAVWNIPSVRANVLHEAQFPKELPRRVIKLLSAPGELVLDPFVGTGTTAVAAIEGRRKYLGFELIPEYADIARARCKGTQPTSSNDT